jgi:hypothetical protein
MSEFAPVWSNARMTAAQVRKYIADMRVAQALAKQKLEEAKNSWDFKKEEAELKKIEQELENL